jgi:uncharacterized protein with GYD domain
MSGSDGDGGERPGASSLALSSSDWRRAMPSYIVLMNWTDQGVKSFRDSVDRAEAAEIVLSPVGIRFTDVRWTVGAYDLIATLETPDEETLAAALLTLAAQGNLRTTTLRAFTSEEMRGVIAKAT